MTVIEIFLEAATVQTVVAIVIGVVAGIIVVLLTRNEKASDDFDSELNDLEERKAYAVAQLRELEAQRDRIDAVAYAEQRAEHEQVATDALRARDELLKKRRRSDLPATFLSDRPGVRGLVWGGGIVLSLAIAWIIVSPNEMPPAAAARGTTTPAIDNPELALVWRQLQKNPADVDALARGGAILASLERFDEAREYIDRALQLDPEHPAALLQYAALLAGDGKTEEALTRLDGLVEKHPDLLDAWSLRGMVAMQAGEVDKAKASLGEYVERAPDGPAKEQMRAMLDDGAPKAKPAANAGAELWGAKCAMCHGADGRAQTRMGESLAVPDLTQEVWQNATGDGRIRTVIEKGVIDEAGERRMQAFDELTPEQIDRLVELIRSWK